MSKFSFHRLARRELDEAAQYYETESPGLGTKYLDAVEDCVRSVAELPAAGAMIRGHVRRRLVQGFPYAVLLPGVPRARSDSRDHEPQTPSDVLGRS